MYWAIADGNIGTLLYVGVHELAATNWLRVHPEEIVFYAELVMVVPD